MKRGGLAILPKDCPALSHLHENIETQLKKELGEHVCVHNQDDKDLRPYLCINKVFFNATRENTTLREIKEKLGYIIKPTGESIKIEQLHWKFNGQLPTNIIKFKTENDNAKE